MLLVKYIRSDFAAKHYLERKQPFLAMSVAI